MPNEPIIQIMSGVTPPKIQGRGRPKGTGCNLRDIARLRAGDPTSCLYRVGKKKMNSLRTSALQSGYKLLTRRDEDGTYFIWLKEQPPAK